MKNIPEYIIDRAAELRKEGLSWRIVGSRLSLDSGSIRAAAVKKYPELLVGKGKRVDKF